MTVKRFCVFASFVIAPSIAFSAVPVISGFSPAMGANGASVSIKGTNFGTFPSNNIVYFGAVRATVTAVTHTNLSVTVPAGATYAPITILVNGLVAYSSKPFEPTFSGTGDGFDATSLAPAISLAMPSGPQEVAIGDMDGDGKPDLIINNCYNHNISLFRNISSGGVLSSNSFGPRVDLPTLPPANGVDNMFDVTVGDIDGDGKLDIVTLDRIANKIIVYRNLSTPGNLDTNSFAAPVFYDVGQNPRGVVVADIDGDGRPDIVFCCVDSTVVSVLRNIGVSGNIDTNSFAAPVSFATGSAPGFTAVGDLDGDGKPDILVANGGDSTISVYRNLSTPGTINFASQVVFPAPSDPLALAIGDIDGDGKADLLVGGYFGPMSVYRNTSTVGTLDTNSFAPRVDFAAPGRCHSIALGDLNGDGKVDIALVTELNDALSLFENVSVPGTFTSTSLAPRVDYASGYNTWGVAIGDLDGDGRPDIAFGNAYDASAWVYQNTMGFAGSTGAPVITQQPTNQTVSLGDPAHFSVTATGSPVLRYQWYGNTGDLIPGATNSTFTISNVMTVNFGNYFVVVSNLVGSVTSSNALLMIVQNAAPGTPIIIKQPTNQTVSAGGTAQFSVFATNMSGAPLFFQWYFGSGTKITGATSPLLVLSNVQPANAGHYYVMVTNQFGAAMSSNAVLTVTGGTNSGGGDCTPAPSGITAWWPGEGNGTDVVNGNNAILESGVAFGAGEVGQAFQLLNYTNGFMHVPASPSLDIGANSNGFTIEGWIKVSEVNNWHPVFEWHGDTRDKLGVELWIHSGGLIGGVIETNSSIQHLMTSAPGTLVANVFQHFAMTYNRVTGVETLYINGANVAQLNAGSVLPETAYDLWVGHRPTDVQGDASFGTALGGSMDELSLYNRPLSQSEVAAIFNAGSAGKCTSNISNLAPAIVQQPVNQTVAAGSNATFLVTATGSLPLHYQWYGLGSAIPGAVNSTLTLSNVQPSNAGNYFVIVSNLFGSATSSNAVLTVTGGTNGGSGSCTPPPSGLVAWWPGEGNANDVVNGNNGVAGSNVTYGVAEVGSGFSFNQPDDSADGYVAIPASPSLDVGATGGLTIEGWVNVGYVNPNGGAPIIEWDSQSADGLQLWVDAPGNKLYANIKDTSGVNHQIQEDVGSVTLNEFKHVALTYDKSSGIARLYVDGSEVKNENFGNITAQTTYPVNIGARTFSGWGSRFNQGIIDELALYNRALTQSEIAAIFNAGSSGKCGGNTSNTAPVITHQPTNQTAAAGGTAHFSVTATGSPTLHYQWYGLGSAIPGAINSTLTLSNVQPSNAGNYFVIVSNLFGSAASSNAVLTVTGGTNSGGGTTLSNALVQIVNTSTSSGATFDVPIILVAKGNENALGFSLNFDASTLTYSNVVLGVNATNGFILLNTSQAATGTVGVVLALPSGQTFPAGTQQIARVTFGAPTATGTQSLVTAVNFADQPIARLVSDAQSHALTASYSNGIVIISGGAIEGDVTPRTSGDGKVNLLDWVQIGRFVAGLDTISNTSEFQRVDCAPRSTLGDGQIKVTDWVQAGRYAAGLDPATPVGGPTGPINSNSVRILPRLPVSRQVTVSGGSIVKGMTTTMPINLQAQGDESALSFSLSFDPTVLKYVSTTNGNAATGATLVVNANQAGSGQLAIVLALPNGSFFPAGLDEIAKVTFVAIGSSAGNAVSFADAPVFRSISDTNATEVDANYVANSVVVNPQPTVKLTPSRGASVLSWPVWAGNFTLQSANSLTPPIIWTNVSVTLQTNGDNIEVTLPASSNGQTFYRLSHP